MPETKKLDTDMAYEANSLLAGINDDLEQARALKDQFGRSEAGRYANILFTQLEAVRHVAEDLVNAIDQEKRNADQESNS